MVHCLRCHQLKETKQMKTIFKTGFIRVNDEDEPIGICFDCLKKTETDKKSAPKAAS